MVSIGSESLIKLRICWQWTGKSVASHINALGKVGWNSFFHVLGATRLQQ
jgi:hypothetical protein